MARRIENEGFGPWRLYYRLPQPPTVITLTPTNVQSTSAQLNANLDSLGGSEYAEVWFVWDTNYHENWQNYSYQSPPINLSTTGYFSYVASNLTPNTEYHLRAVGQNPIDSRQGGDTFFYTTYSLPVVTTLPATQVQSTSAQLNANLYTLGGDDNCDIWFVFQ